MLIIVLNELNKIISPAIQHKNIHEGQDKAVAWYCHVEMVRPARILPHLFSSHLISSSHHLLTSGMFLERKYVESAVCATSAAVKVSSSLETTVQ
jgi:hypothetical protein